MNYANIKNNDIANGLGVRVSLFVSGCTHHCKGCFNAEAWDFNYGNEFTKDVENQIIEMLRKPHIKGITLLGGEPMEPKNQECVANLIKRVKSELPDKNIWLYSGFTLEDDLLNTTGRAHTIFTMDILKNVDVLVDGKFELDKKSLSLKFRGSSNQRLIDLKSTLSQNKLVLFKVR